MGLGLDVYEGLSIALGVGVVVIALGFYVENQWVNPPHSRKIGRWPIRL